MLNGNDQIPKGNGTIQNTEVRKDRREELIVKCCTSGTALLRSSLSCKSLQPQAISQKKAQESQATTDISLRYRSDIDQVASEGDSRHIHRDCLEILHEPALILHRLDCTQAIAILPQQIDLCKALHLLRRIPNLSKNREVST